jgi:hypothetical protein
MLVPVYLRSRVIFEPILVIIEVLLVHALSLLLLLPHALFLLPLPLEFLLDLKIFFSPLLVLVELSLALVLCLEDLALASKGVHVLVLKAHIVLACGTSLGFAATVRYVFLILLKLDHLLAVFAGFWLE